MDDLALNLPPELGLLFRITHVTNIPWPLANGLNCASSELKDPIFISVAKADDQMPSVGLIQRATVHSRRASKR
jgi:hypothetical protein